MTPGASVAHIHMVAASFVLKVRIIISRHAYVGLARNVSIHRIMTVYLEISLLKLPYTNCMYMVLANPMYL